MDQTNVQLDGTNVARKNEHSFFGKKISKGAWRAFLSNLSQGLTVPIAVMPIAGLCLGIGAAIAIHAENNEGLKVFGQFIQNMGDFFFGNLPLLFAVTIAIAYAKQAGIAAFTAVVAFATFCGIQQAIILPEEINVIGGSSVSLGTYSILFYGGIPGSVVGKSMGITSLQTSVFGGILIGAVSAWTYNKFHQLKLPAVLGFFNGTRAVPIIVIAFMAPVTILVAMLWPGIGLGLAGLGVGLGVLSQYGNLASFFFGYIERALVPTGLHHAFYSPLWFSQVGGDMYTPMMDSSLQPMIWYNDKICLVQKIGEKSFEGKTWGALIEQITGKNIEPDKWTGDSKLWMAVNSICGGKWTLIDAVDKKTVVTKEFTPTFYTFAQWTFNKLPEAVRLIEGKELAHVKGNFTAAFPGVNPGQYMQGKYSFMDYGLPAAAAAMIMSAPKENRKFASSIVGSAAFTSMLTGITEPIEFTFLFLSPALFWGVHAFFCALSFWLVTMFGAHIGMTFSGGLIDFMIYGVMPDALGHKTDCWIAILLGLAYIPIYYFVFYFWIKFFKLETPGRGGVKLYTKKDYLAREEEKKAAASQTTTAATGGQQAKVNLTQVKAYRYLQALGGKANVENANACITKLRPVVKDVALVDESALKRCGALGVSHAGNSYSIVIGTEAPLICQAIIDIINGQINEEVLKKAVME